MRSKKHLDYIRQLPCACCLRDRSDQHREAHHLLRDSGKGLGMKAGDEHTIPLCTQHHNDLHQSGDEKVFFAKYHIKRPTVLALALEHCSGDHAEGRRAIIRSKKP